MPPRAALPWIVVLDEPGEGAWNMNVDRALLADALRTGQSWLRLYAFSPPTISLGRSESAERVLDLDACRGAGVGVVQRPTGGRAVLHDEELTYAVAIPAGEPTVGDERESVGRFTGEVLRDALASLGLGAEVVRTTTAPAAAGGYRSCFASASRWEVAVDGRKIVGSAQRRWPGAVLQHGSILLGPGFRRLGAFVRGGGEVSAAAARELARATCASECLARTVTRAETAGAVRAALEARVGRCDVVTGLPTRITEAVAGESARVALAILLQ